jgi:hypothetical protein
MAYPTSTFDYGAGVAAPTLGTYTQTYATADKTHANPTAAAVVTTGAALTSYGFTEAQANAIVTAVNALRADHLDLAQLVNAILDDLQAISQ